MGRRRSSMLAASGRQNECLWRSHGRNTRAASQQVVLEGFTWAHSQPPREVRLLPAGAPPQAVRPSGPLSRLSQPQGPFRGKVCPDPATACPGPACMPRAPGRCPHLSPASSAPSGTSCRLTPCSECIPGATEESRGWPTYTVKCANIC